MMQAMRIVWERGTEGKRGRPRGLWRSYADRTNFMYLIRVAQKHGVNSKKLFECIYDAWKHEKSLCEKIMVRCREKIDGHAIFCITKDQDIVTQLKLTDGMLGFIPNIAPLNFQLAESTQIRKTPPAKVIRLQIRDLIAGVKNVSLSARVMEKPAARTVFSRYGDILLVSNMVVSDGTGTIIMPLWNQQIDTISIGDMIQIGNGWVKQFRGELQLRVHSGKIRVIEHARA